MFKIDKKHVPLSQPGHSTSLKASFEEDERGVSVGAVEKIFGPPQELEYDSISWSFSDAEGRPYTLYDYSKYGECHGNRLRVGNWGSLQDNDSRRSAVQFKGWILYRLGLINKMTALIKYKASV